MLQVWVETDILDNADLVLTVVDRLKVGWWREVKHLLDSVVAGIELDKVLGIG